MMTTTVTTQSTSVHLSAVMGNQTPLMAGPLPAASLQSAITSAVRHSSSSPAVVASSVDAPSTSGNRRIQPAPSPRPPQPPLMPPALETTKAANNSSMSGLLNRNLDEKLVVATLATLDSGTASNLIKQDLKYIIQSRRKAEGKAELQVEFKKPIKEEQLTSEEVVKRSRRRELNRLAARRSREKGQKRKDLLVEEIRKLQSANTELMDVLGSLTEQRNQIIETLRQHMKQCSDYEATQKASVGLSHRVLGMLGFHTVPEADQSQAHLPPPPAAPLPSPTLPVSTETAQPPAVAEVPGMSTLYISTSNLVTSAPQHPLIKSEGGSCPPSPQVLGASRGLASFTSYPNPKDVLPGAVAEVVAPDTAVGKLQGLDPSTLLEPGLKVMLASPSLSGLEGMNPPVPVYLVSSLAAATSPLELASPVVAGPALKTPAAVISIDGASHFQSPLAKVTSDALEKSHWSSPLPPAAAGRPAVNLSAPVSPAIPMPIAPAPPSAGSIQGRRRSSTASLPGVGGEGMPSPLLSPRGSSGSDSAAGPPQSSQSGQSDSGLGSSQEDARDGRGEEVVVQYKHKLMKHRKQHSTDFTRPSTHRDTVRGAWGRAILLERSFSFPSSRCEQLRSPSAPSKGSDNPSAPFIASCHPPSCHVSTSSAVPLGFLNQSVCSRPNASLSSSSSVIAQALPSSASSFLSPSDNSSALDSIGSNNSISSSISKPQSSGSSSTTRLPHHSHHCEAGMDEENSSMEEGEEVVLPREAPGWSPMDTWPPAGTSRSSRGPLLERRWSVDDYTAAPLNLSRRSSQEDSSRNGREGEVRAMSSRSSSPDNLPGSLGKGFVYGSDKYS